MSRNLEEGSGYLEHLYGIQPPDIWVSAYLDILLSYLDVGYLAHLYGIQPPDIWMNAYLDILLPYLNVGYLEHLYGIQPPLSGCLH